MSASHEFPQLCQGQILREVGVQALACKMADTLKRELQHHFKRRQARHICRTIRTKFFKLRRSDTEDAAPDGASFSANAKLQRCRAYGASLYRPLLAACQMPLSESFRLDNHLRSEHSLIIDLNRLRNAASIVC